MAAQLMLLDEVSERPAVAFDGLRSCVTSQDYPCDITTVVEREGEMILSMTHTIMRRGGRMTEKQRKRMEEKSRSWAPEPGSVSRSISLTCREIGDYLRPSPTSPATIDTDENPLYASVIRRSPVYLHLTAAGQLCHLKTPSTAPRTMENRQFPVNYVDRLLRHRLKEHSRETIAIGRHAVMQMHRAWLFAFDHNVRREHRVRKPLGGVHAQWGGVPTDRVEMLKRGFFRRRIRPVGALVPESIRQVWLGEVATPPVRWKVGQRGSSVRIPRFARRDLAGLNQQAETVARPGNVVEISMSRYKDYEPHQRVFIEFSGSDYFGPESFERFVVDTFSSLDVSELTGSDQPSEDRGGETPYDPRGLFGVIFYGFARGVFSSRKLERACKDDVGFMYVSGFAKPDHATFSRCISERREEIGRIFARILYLADEQGHLDYRLIATDGTKIRANASSRFTGTMREFEKKRDRFEKKIEEALERLDRATDSEERQYWQKKLTRYRENRDRIAQFLKEGEAVGTKHREEVRQNITDRDCRVMRVDGSYREAYNAQASAAGEKGIIVAATVGNNVDDKENLFRMQKLVQASDPNPDQERKEKPKYLFDAGYYSPTNILDAAEARLDVYIPEGTDRSYYGGQDPPAQRTTIGVADCEIDEDAQGLYLRCPGGRTLREWRIRRVKGSESYAFRVRSTDEECRRCEFYRICVGKHKTPFKTFSVRTRHVDERATLKAYEVKMDSEVAKRIYSRRMPMIERPFAYAKETIGFTRFLRRGLDKVRNEWLLVCGAYNLKRLFALSSA
jgi:transposase